MKKLFFVILLFPLFVQAEDFVQVSMGKGGVYSVPGSINGKPYNFLIDTGATSFAISGKVAYGLGMVACEVDGVSVTAGGKSKFCSVVVESVTVAGFEFNNVPAIVMPKLEGVLLGNSMLKNFTVTQKNGVMTLAR